MSMGLMGPPGLQVLDTHVLHVIHIVHIMHVRHACGKLPFRQQSDLGNTWLTVLRSGIPSAVWLP